MWGNGDARTKVVSRLTPEDEKAIETAATELLAHVREGAARRRLPQGASEGRGGEGFATQLQVYTYNGIQGVSVTLPPPGQKRDAAAAAERRAARDLVSHLRQSVRQRADMYREQGP